MSIMHKLYYCHGNAIKGFSTLWNNLCDYMISLKIIISTLFPMIIVAFTTNKLIPMANHGMADWGGSAHLLLPYLTSAKAMALQI
jgi:hypothetical protein